MIIGLLILCVYAPWTQPDPNSPNVHQTIGYAPVWSQAYAQTPTAHVDWSGAFAAYAAGIVFFSIVLGAISRAKYYLAAIVPRLYSTNLNKAIINKANLEDLERRAPGRRNSVPGDLG